MKKKHTKYTPEVNFSAGRLAQLNKRQTLHYAGQPGSGFGWGVCNTNLRRELVKHFELIDGAADIVFMPLVDHSLNPATSARGQINVAYTFFEFPLGPDAAANAAKYDIVFCGSAWCKERLAEKGIHNTEVLIQGVDQSIFYPRPRKPDGQFRIFSGGKFEYRKGQDLVIRAFAQFAKDHPEAHLVCAWFNPWPKLAIECAQMAGLAAQGSTLEAFYEDMLCRAGIPRDRFTILPQLSHAKLAEQMAQTDCGLFPNRCEGGTNLVLMEYASCGGLTVANRLTGQEDVDELISVSIPAFYDDNKWAVQSPAIIADSLEVAKRNVNSGRVVIIPTWEQSAKTVANAIERLAVAV
jgi:glycosyltransferase involved in cell wall biosynthesis